MDSHFRYISEKDRKHIILFLILSFPQKAILFLFALENSTINESGYYILSLT